ncbi:MAG: hypothetical protein B6U95_01610 [Thermofilum sp. ex4484_82]|nr:MAG: hypothetical protein B6U95_01610 [Thermofilum sp. ex4484_82]OYT39593.1 MAG: hypothetical protein B6U96_01615 [Archaeoglobales archaeon ex4484_92]
MSNEDVEGFFTDVEKKIRPLKKRGEKIFFKIPRSAVDVLRKEGGGVAFLPFIVENEKLTGILTCGVDMPRTSKFDVNIQIDTVRTPFGAIIRMVLTIFDDPYNPLKLEMFVNPKNKEHVEDFLRLSNQTWIPVAFFDLSGKIRTTSRISLGEKIRSQVKRHLEMAEKVNREIKTYNFNKAKQYIIERFPL